MSKIVWDDTDKMQLADAVAEIVFMDRNVKLMSALKQVQAVLPATKRRNLSRVSITSVKWLTEMVDARIHRMEREQRDLNLEMARISKENKSTVIPLDEATTEQLVSALLERLVPMMAQALAATPAFHVAIREAHSVCCEEVQSKAPSRSKVRLKRVLVLGLLPKQAREVASRLGNVLDLRFEKGDNARLAREMSGTMDAVFIHTDHMNHSTEAAVRSGIGSDRLFRRVTGGVTSMIESLEEYYASL